MLNKKKQGTIQSRIFYGIVIVLLVFVGFGVFKTSKYFPFIYQLFFNKTINLKVTKDKTVNILLLGIGGGTHDGPDLTDTIIFASLNPANNKVTLVSIPRDLWFPSLQGKINTAYTMGGLAKAKDAVSSVIGQPINYGVRIDFGGFVKAVDLVKGLDIIVDRAFDDNAYPIEGKEDDTCGYTDQQIQDLTSQIATGSASETDAFPCRYMQLHFDKGLQHMDGQTALEYVRSRHALGIEGTDFARSARQQKVIEAFKQKLFSAGTILNPTKIIGLYTILKDSIDTDIQPNEYDSFIKLAQKLKGVSIKSTVLDIGDPDTNRLGLLTNPTDTSLYAGAWVLIPRIGNDNYSEIHSYVTCEIVHDKCIIGEHGILTPTPIQTIIKKK